MAENLSGGGQVLQTVGFEMTAHDGGLSPLGSYWAHQVPGVHCRTCCGTFDFDYVSPDARTTGRWDAAWIDGRTIVGERFRAFCLRNEYTEVALPCIDARRRLYELRPTRALEVDIDRSQPLLTDFCTTCGNFQCCLRGHGLFFVDVKEPLEDGIYRTDLVFGCAAGKHPLIIVAPTTMRKLKALRLRRLTFTPVPNIDPEFEERKAAFKRVYAGIRRKQRASLRRRMKAG